ncbi:hypothetical protein AKO1_008791 [Acrasis kona]|uniref:J domain-containing protein n=1 Tax=Acrasis kona TaxID=1008807 RepID=A0AAW2ZH87_9EUKA
METPIDVDAEPTESPIDLNGESAEPPIDLNDDLVESPIDLNDVYPDPSYQPESTFPSEPSDVEPTSNPDHTAKTEDASAKRLESEADNNIDFLLSLNKEWNEIDREEDEKVKDGLEIGIIARLYDVRPDETIRSLGERVLKGRYRKLMHRYHPDCHQDKDDPRYTEITTFFNSTWDAIKDFLRL